MKEFTLINLLTNQFTVVTGECRIDASIKAISSATKLGLDSKNHFSTYWIEKQDYHDITDFTELKEVVEGTVFQDVPRCKIVNDAIEKLTLEQIKNSFLVDKAHIEHLQQKAGDATTLEDCRKLNLELHDYVTRMRQSMASIIYYLNTGEWA